MLFEKVLTPKQIALQAAVFVRIRIYSRLKSVVGSNCEKGKSTQVLEANKQFFMCSSIYKLTIFPTSPSC